MLKYLIEIRNKFILLTLTLFSTVLICFYYKHVLLFLVTQMHLKSENLYFIFTDVTELFSVYFRLVFFISIQIVVWYCFYHLFSFIATALYFQEFKILTFLLISSTFFWVLTGFLSSYILVPFGWNFFLSFQDQPGFYFEARISEYFNFYKNMYVLCLTYCQLFVFIFIFLLDIQQSYFYVRKYRKVYYYIFLLFATCVTPPDLISQVIATFLLIIVYELLLLLAMFNLCIQKLKPVTSSN